MDQSIKYFTDVRGHDGAGLVINMVRIESQCQINLEDAVESHHPDSLNQRKLIKLYGFKSRCHVVSRSCSDFRGNFSSDPVNH